MRGKLQLYQKVRDRSILIALSARTMMVNVSSSAYYPRSKLCWTGIELRPIGRVSIAGDDLPGHILKRLPVRRLPICVAHHEDAPLRREVCLVRLIAADHRRRNGGVAAQRHLVIVTGVALKQPLTVGVWPHPRDERAAERAGDGDKRRHTVQAEGTPIGAEWAGDGSIVIQGDNAAVFAARAVNGQSRGSIHHSLLA